jgi:DNA-binding transcriptional MocR family regulator
MLEDLADVSPPQGVGDEARAMYNGLRPYLPGRRRMGHGDSLPTVRTPANGYGVSHGTVAKALHVLADEQLVVVLPNRHQEQEPARLEDRPATRPLQPQPDDLRP